MAVDCSTQLIRVLDRVIGSELYIGDLALNRVELPKLYKLTIRQGRWQRFQGPWPDKSSYFDKKVNEFKFEEWTLSLRIRHVNKHRECVTTKNDRYTHMLGKYRCPMGLHVFNPSKSIMPVDIDTRLDALFERNDGSVLRDPGSNIIFYSHELGKRSPPLKITLNALKDLDVDIYNTVLLYASAVKKILNASDDDIDNSSMSIVKYAIGKGIKQHIDNITDVGDTVGPLVSIALGEGKKFLDLMPTLADDPTLECVRVEVDKGDVILMDGDVRLEYSHSVPYGHDTVMYSLLFKFREIRRIRSGKINLQLQTEIIYTIDPRDGEIPV